MPLIRVKAKDIRPGDVIKVDRGRAPRTVGSTHVRNRTTEVVFRSKGRRSHIFYASEELVEVTRGTDEPR